ncbi:TIM barrel protein [Nonomuraea jabiensis]|uniref:TIM barrel protein n=1 Tax=Nonomuraea jabiensis TaxID=882448 RepID=UPI003D74EC28
MSLRYRGAPLAANVSILFTELPYRERFAAAAAAGFGEVESWWPFGTPDPDPAEVDGLLAAIRHAGVRLVALNFWAGDMPAGERGVATHSERSGELRRNIPALRAIADQTGCARFNLLVGRLAPETGRETQIEHAARTVATAARAMAGTGTVLLEPLSGLPEGAFPLVTDLDVAGFRERVGEENVALLFDVYHLGANGVDVVAAAERSSGTVGHVQLADAPGRGAPGTGTLPIAGAVDILIGHGYAGPIGCEYVPGGPTADTLGWVDQ